MASAGTASSNHAFSTLRTTATRGRTVLCLVVALVCVVFGEPVRRPVGFRRVAAARAVERGDVLQRDQDVPVQLDVGDVLDIAVRGQHAVLILAAEERDLDLLALVLVGVVLHRAPADQSIRAIVRPSTRIRWTWQFPTLGLSAASPPHANHAAAIGPPCVMTSTFLPSCAAAIASSAS